MADYEHIFLSGSCQRNDFVSTRSGRAKIRLPEREQFGHAAVLKHQWRAVWARFNEAAAAAVQPAGGEPADDEQMDPEKGEYIDFISAPGYGLNYKSLEDVRKGIRLANVVTRGAIGQEVTRATLFIPYGLRSKFEKKLEAYGQPVEQVEGEHKKKPKNDALMRGIETIENSGIASLWTDDPDLMPGVNDPALWYELWITTPDGRKCVDSVADPDIAGFRAKATGHGVVLSSHCMVFPGRAVFAALATVQQLMSLFADCPRLAEIKRNRIPANEFVEEAGSRMQEALADELLSRCDLSPESTVAVNILDSGVMREHRLLKNVLEVRDCHSCIDGARCFDRDGHGTAMAGVAAFGDLGEALSSCGRIAVPYVLESAKIYRKDAPAPEDGKTEPYGWITSDGVSRVEVERSTRTHIHCMAVTTPDESSGKPSSWSAAVDQLAYGDHDEGQDRSRLMIVSAGNVDADEDYRDYPQSNERRAVLDPAQSWNALTVGAYTMKNATRDPSLQVGYEVLAKAGELSPFSRTSLPWKGGAWPIKPEVVFEGGNVMRHVGDDEFSCKVPDLVLMSTKNSVTTPLYTYHNATSAATALAARFAARVQSRYKNARPETVRALMVHSATWTPQLKDQYRRMRGLPPEVPLQKNEYAELLRFCGYGVPQLDRALNSHETAFTLVREDTLHPYKKVKGKGIAFGDCVIYDLPWPVDALLGDVQGLRALMRVTLSYFIEPSPCDVGWGDRYAYASHALRFAVCRPHESKEEFAKRINKAMRDSTQSASCPSHDDDNWVIGPTARNHGSVHSDIIEDAAASIATRHYVAVYPVGGWWRTRTGAQRYDRSVDYSLVVSLEAPQIGVDLYSLVKTQIATPVAQATVV